MLSIYFIVAPPSETFFCSLYQQLSDDIQKGFTVSQCFFYADAVAIGTLPAYSKKLQDMMILADEQDIALNLCSAAFQSRHLTLSDLAKQDFIFKGLGQFIAESQTANHIRVFAK